MMATVLIFLFSFPWIERSHANDNEVDNITKFGSVKLITKAWEALDNKDLETVLIYTDECIRRFSKTALRMQSKLKEFPFESIDHIHANWALNDVAAAYFIKAEAHRQNGQLEEAKLAYQTIIDEFKFGQCWDQRGWFWKPADAAKNMLDIIKLDIDVDFGDYRSVTLVVKAWEALEENKLREVLAYTNMCIKLYSQQAAKMQRGLKDYTSGNNDEIHANWALNDVATAYFIKAEAYRLEGQMEKAKIAYQKIIDEYKFGQCWDPLGWFWKPVESAKNMLDVISTGVDVNFRDYRSAALVNKAWKALEENQSQEVLAYTKMCIKLYSQQAAKMRPQ
jgi:tetratricopeptide (TPR) repeat protein